MLNEQMKKDRKSEPSNHLAAETRKTASSMHHKRTHLSYQWQSHYVCKDTSAKLAPENLLSWPTHITKHPMYRMVNKKHFGLWGAQSIGGERFIKRHKPKVFSTATQVRRKGTQV